MRGAIFRNGPEIRFTLPTSAQEADHAIRSSCPADLRVVAGIRDGGHAGLRADLAALPRRRRRQRRLGHQRRRRDRRAQPDRRQRRRPRDLVDRRKRRRRPRALGRHDLRHAHQRRRADHRRVLRQPVVGGQPGRGPGAALAERTIIADPPGPAARQPDDRSLGNQRLGQDRRHQLRQLPGRGLGADADLLEPGHGDPDEREPCLCARHQRLGRHRRPDVRRRQRQQLPRRLEQRPAHQPGRSPRHLFRQPAAHQRLGADRGHHMDRRAVPALRRSLAQPGHALEWQHGHRAAQPGSPERPGQRGHRPEQRRRRRGLERVVARGPRHAVGRRRAGRPEQLPGRDRSPRRLDAAGSDGDQRSRLDRRGRGQLEHRAVRGLRAVARRRPRASGRCIDGARPRVAAVRAPGTTRGADGLRASCPATLT
jgi:hypothetical protein